MDQARSTEIQQPRLSHLDRAMIINWSTISAAYFSGNYTGISTVGISSNSDVKKKVALILSKNTQTEWGRERR